LREYIAREHPSVTGFMAEPTHKGTRLHAAVARLEEFYGGRLPRRNGHVPSLNCAVEVRGGAIRFWKLLRELSDADDEEAYNAAEDLLDWAEPEIARVKSLLSGASDEQTPAVRPSREEAEASELGDVSVGASLRRYSFRRSGANFKVHFGDEKGDIPADRRGAQYIHLLLQNTHQAIEAIELEFVARQSGGVQPPGAVDSAQLASPQRMIGQSGETTARYAEVLAVRRAELNKEKAGLQEEACRLKKECEEARQSKHEPRLNRSMSDLERIAERVKEIDREEGQLKRGRLVPEEGDPAEKSRKSVGAALRRLYKSCRERFQFPKLAGHLESSIKTEGKSYAYRPKRPEPDWELW
jgi:hypothetical protein